MPGLNMKEPVNAWTHLVACAAAFVGLVFLVVRAWGNVPKLTVMLVYGLSAVALFGASTLYHWLKASPKVELLLKRVDHSAIYLMIAGSATPVFYYGLDSAWRATMLAAMWGLAAAGILLKVWFIRLPRSISTALYLAMGWIAVVPFVKLLHTLPPVVLVLLALGGVFYTIGAVIYATKRLDFFPNRFGFHEVFHLFVVAGGAAHYAMIALLVPLEPIAR